MISELEKIANLGGTVSTVLIFVWYLTKQGELQSKKDESINKIISNHLDHSTKVIENNGTIITKVEVALKELCILFRKSNKGERGEKGEKGKAGDIYAQSNSRRN